MAGHAFAADYPPVNPHLVDSPWPLGGHRDTYRQASTPLAGPEPGDNLVVDTVEIPTGSFSLAGASPWLCLSHLYPDGSRVLWGANFTHVFKVLADEVGLEVMASYRIDWDITDASMDLISMKGPGGETEVYLPDGAKIIKFKDSNPDDPYSSIQKVWTKTLPSGYTEGPAGPFLTPTWDGWIATYGSNKVGVLKSDASEFYEFTLPSVSGEEWGHNSFPIDENNRFYIQSTHRVICVQWDGVNTISEVWSAMYDFVGDGAGGGVLNTSGSGTTNTLMGTGSMDKLIITVDGWNNNNMVAFWREEIPADWPGIPGYDRRVAAVVGLPYSTNAGEGYIMECSPAVLGYSVVAAQYAGFEYDCTPPPGVQKLSWSPTTRTLDIDWTNSDVFFGGVCTISEASNLVYQSGRVGGDCTFKFYGLDWDTGAVALEIPLGTDDLYKDQGNAVEILEGNRATFSGKWHIVQVRPDDGGSGGSCGAAPLNQGGGTKPMLALAPLFLGIFLTGLWFLRGNKF